MTKRIKMTGLLAVLAAACIGVGLLTETANASVESNVGETVWFTSDEKIEVEYGAYSTNGKKGAKISLSGVAGKNEASIDYLNYISTECLADGFLSLGMMPSAVGTNLDFDYLSVTLTDAMDESRQIIYTIASPSDRDTMWPNYVTSWVTLTEEFDTCTSELWGGHKELRFKESNQLVFAKNSFVGPTNPNYTGSYNDTGYNFTPNQKNKLFVQETDGASLQEMKFAFEDNAAKINGGTVAQIDNTEFLSMNTAAVGDEEILSRYTKEHVENLFSSGYVKMKFTYLGLNVDKVTLHIEQIGSQVLAKNEGCRPIDESPFMSADIPSNAVVGYSYNMPRLMARDLIDGDLTNRVECWIKKDGNVVKSGYGAYEFTSSGEYVFSYSVKNNRGNTFLKEYSVTCFGEMPKTSYGSVLGYKDTYYVGDVVVIPSVNVYNDLSTQEDKQVEGEVIVQCDGKVVERFGTSKSYNYTLEKAGDYAVILSYFNEFGIIQSKVLKFQVEKGLSVSPDLIPVSFTAGKTNRLYDMDVYNSLNEKSFEDIYRTVLVNGKKVYEAKGDEVTYGSLVLSADALSETGTAELTFAAGFASGEYESKVEYDIPVIKPKYVGDYVIASDAETVYKTEGVQVEYYEDEVVLGVTRDTTFTLPNLLVSDDLSLSFDVKADSAVKNLRLLLIDGKYPDKYLAFTFMAATNTSSFLLAEGATYTVGGSFMNDESYFNLNWDDEKKLLTDLQGVALTSAITKWGDGSEFNGFSEGLVKVSFSLESVEEAGARFAIKQVCNSSFGSDIISGKVSAFFDMYAPIINVQGGTIVQNVGLGERLIVAAATAYDVFDTATSVTVTVKNSNGQVLLENAPCQTEQTVIIPTYGVWVVTYTAQDSTGIVKTNKVLTYKVTDDIAPLLTLQGEVKASYKVGEKATFPKAVVWDNYTQELEVEIFVLFQNGQRISCDGTYKFEKKGEYRVVYYAYDEAYNFKQLQFDVFVV